MDYMRKGSCLALGPHHGFAVSLEISLFTRMICKKIPRDLQRELESRFCANREENILPARQILGHRKPVASEAINFKERSSCKSSLNITKAKMNGSLNMS